MPPEASWGRLRRSESWCSACGVVATDCLAFKISFISGCEECVYC
jgi:hypothetical protein